MRTRHRYLIVVASMMVLALVSGAAALSVSVAASDSSSTAKSQATYVCSGTNDRTQITTALSAVAAAGGGTVTLSGGTFSVTPFSIPANVVLQGAGSGSTKLVFTTRGGISMPGSYAGITGMSVSGPGMVQITASHIALRDVVIRSTGKLWGAFSVEAITPKTSLEDIEFVNCQALDCDTIGFMVSASEYSYVLKNLRFINCRAVNCGAAAQFNPWVVGFDLAERCSIDGMLVDGCYAAGSYESGFHFEGQPTVRNVVMRNCVSENNGLSPTALWGAGYVVGEGTVLENCRSANNQYGFYVHGSVGITKCVDSGSDTSFILGRYLSGVTMTDVGSKNAKETALTALDNSNLHVTNLVVENCLGSTPVLAPRPINSVIDWHYGSVSSIGTTAPTTTTVATPMPTQTVVSSTTAPSVTQPPSTGGSTPYPAAHAAPGRVEAEDYNVGGFSDTTAANEGGAYRNDAVDIEAGGANYNVGWIRAGEYLEYSVDAASAGTYTVSLRVANPGTAKTVKVVTNGASKDLTIPATGSFATWQTAVLTGVSLNQGRNVIRVNMNTASSFNLDYMDLAASATAQPTPTTSAQTASIKFTSVPSGSSIYIDGGYKGVTPATISGITLGTHRAEIRRTGYQTWVKTIQVTSDFVGRYKPYSYNPTLVKL